MERAYDDSNDGEGFSKEISIVLLHEGFAFDRKMTLEAEIEVEELMRLTGSHFGEQVYYDEQGILRERYHDYQLVCDAK